MPRTVYHRAIPDFSGCQSLPTVLDNTTVTFENFTISYLSLNCPLVSCNTTKRATIEQRDPICATGATCECYPNLPLDKKLLEQRALTGNIFTGTVDCTSLGDTPIDTADCTPIIQFLESMDPSKPPIFVFLLTLLFERTALLTNHFPLHCQPQISRSLPRHLIFTTLTLARLAFGITTAPITQPALATL